ncbi:MAG: DedA family protein [Bacteroidaceae bacterium]
MDIVQLFSSLLENLNYFYVFLLMVVESTIIPFPSEVVVAPAAFMAVHGEMNIFLVVLYATLGAVVGASINYWGAYFVGRPLVYRFANSKFGHLCLINKEKVERSEKYFDDHGAMATLIGRLLPVIRQLISVPAGLAKMNFWQFLLYTTIGAAAWNIILAFLGWSLAQGIDYEEFKVKLAIYNGYISKGILLVFLLCVLFFVIKAYLKRSKKGK